MYRYVLCVYISMYISYPYIHIYHYIYTIYTLYIQEIDRLESRQSIKSRRLNQSQTPSPSLERVIVVDMGEVMERLELGLGLGLLVLQIRILMVL